ncbi:ABC transporter ATP-binding protein [Vallitalea okinawensis]|uniref:ABC transporter ATP-binding protein n=1 Tax=Vallitalea okinawensis TaxID=2078660 RepID=UPI000CFA9014|nr:ATP-binding cassette domain-containing protein [Vallitalea okinawensis]
MEILRFENVYKSYNKEDFVIENLNLSVNKGEFLTLIGPSGCGKTTMLKLINGLIKPNSGSIYLYGKELSQWNPIELKRNIGYVIQQIGLFPHLTVAENISFVLNIKKVPKKEREEKAADLIQLVGLEKEYLSRYPRELSGGQRQRIGVARALAADPDIILMDEPLGAVDEISRRVLQDEILRIYSELKKTIIFVTHDIEEALKLGSKVVLFNQGIIEQIGTKEEMIFSPSSQFVIDFLGLKGFTSYLNVAAVGDVYKSINDQMIQRCSNQTDPTLNIEAPIMEGIRVMFDLGVDRIGVKNNEGYLVGEFSLSDLYENTKLSKKVS